MEQHLIATHHLSDQDVMSLPRDSVGTIESLHVRPSLSSHSVIVTKADMEAERLFEELYDHPQNPADGGEDRFWVGGHDSFGQPGQGDLPWLDEEAEMRRLIDDELSS